MGGGLDDASPAVQTSGHSDVGRGASRDQAAGRASQRGWTKEGKEEVSHERLGAKVSVQFYFWHSGKALEGCGQELHHPICIVKAIFWLPCGKQRRGGRG